VNIDKPTVADLFDKPRRYLVPLFQRQYVWNQYEQWEPLWADVKEQVEVLRRHRASDNRPARKHFLGAVVLSQAKTLVRQVPASEVIDGQQRLTTLQIMLAALRDVVAPLGSDFLTTTLNRLTTNPEPLSDPVEVCKVWPTNADREDFQALMSAQSAASLKELYPPNYKRRRLQPRPRLIDAYLFFHQAMSHYLRGEDGGEPHGRPDESLRADLAEELFEALCKYVQLVEIQLEPDDDPQVIFETLNARGVPLEPSDLIRNFVFLYASRHKEEIESLYAKHWREFDTAPALSGKSETKRFWKDMERQGRLKRSRLDLFLFHYVTYRAERELKIGHLFHEFRDWWESVSERSTDAELSLMRASAGVYRSLVIPEKDSRFGIFAARLRALDTTTVYPLVLMLGENRSAVSVDDLDGMLDDVESYLVRRTVCGLTPKNYNRVFFGLLQALRKADTISRSVLRKELTALQGDSTVWPNDEFFRQHWLNAPAYNAIGAAKTQMVLAALDQALDTPRQERIRLDEWLTVEHVLPQSASLEEWPYPPNTSRGDGPIDERLVRRARLVHSFGNLTLLTRPLNSSVSNGSFSAKRPRITEQSRLQLNAYFQRFGEADMWNEDSIAQRGEELFAVARRVWPYPD